MIFSLDLVSEDLELNLTDVSAVSYLLVFIEHFNFNLDDQFSYQFCN